MKVYVLISLTNKESEEVVKCMGVYTSKEKALEQLKKNSDECFKLEPYNNCGGYEVEYVEDTNDFTYTVYRNGYLEKVYEMFQYVEEKELE